MTEQEIRALHRKDRQQGNAALFDTYYSYVCAVVFRRVLSCGTREDAEECVIDVFHEVIRSFDSIREGGLHSYIAACAHNHAVNLCRSLNARARHSTSADLTECDSGEDIPDNAEDAEQARILLECIRELGEPDASGRRSPKDTGKRISLPCTAMLTALGEKADGGLLSAFGLPLTDKGWPEADRETKKTPLEGVYAIGDMQGGPSVVVKCIASAQAAVDDAIDDVLGDEADDEEHMHHHCDDEDCHCHDHEHDDDEEEELSPEEQD